MYLPDHFRNDDVAEMHALMRARPLATLVSAGPSGLYATHLSRLGEDRTADLRTACGECGTRPSLTHSRWLDYLITRNLTASAALDRLVNDGIDRPFSDHDGLIGRFEYAPSALR